MNSWESLEECFELNPDGTELDIQMTSDGVLVCYHDEKLDKTTTCHGTMSKITWAELTGKCEYHTWSNSKRFARLDSVISKFGKPGTILSLDLKEGGTNHEHNLRMRGNIQRLIVTNPQIQFLIETWDRTGSWGFENLPENVLFFQLCGDAENGLTSIKSNGFNGISMDYRNITQNQVTQLHDQGFYVMVYGANTASGNKQATALSPDFIQSDRLDHLIQGFSNMRD